MNKLKRTDKYKKVNSNNISKENIEYNNYVRKKENIYKNIWS